MNTIKKIMIIALVGVTAQSFVTAITINKSILSVCCGDGGCGCQNQRPEPRDNE